MAFTVENKGKAKLVFLHERAFWGTKVEVKLNGQKVIDLSNNHYFEIEVEAENIDIIINRNSNYTQDVYTNLLTEPNKIYYLKIYREVDYFTDKLYLVRVSEQTAKQAMKSMKLEKIPLKNE